MRKNVLLEHLRTYVQTKSIFLRMKLTGFIVLMMCVQVSAGSFAQQKININANKASITSLLKEIEKQTEYRFVYSHNTLSSDKKTSLNLSNASLQEAMASLLKETSLSYALKESNLVVIYPASVTEKKDILVSGKVLDEQGMPLPGVSVKVSGLSVATATDGNGAFTIRVPDGNAVLEISSVGFAKQLVTVGNRTSITIVLKTDSQGLKEVVVTGYTAYKRVESPSASTLVSAEKINNVAGLTLDQILQGRVPGMSVISTSGQPGQSASTVIRGIGSINGSSTPLYVLDGVPIEGGYFQTINPEDIESAVVLKDASAKALYGSRGSNGVIILTTKKGKAGKVAVSYTSQYGFSNLSRPNFPMMNTAQRLQFEEEIGVDFGLNLGPGWTYSPKNPNYTNGTGVFRQRADQILDSLKKIQTDWRDFFFQRGKFQEQQVSVSGGNDKVRFYNSLNYYNQEGVAKRTGQERYALRSNIDFKDDKFSGNVNISIGYSQSSFTEDEGSTTKGTAMASVYYALPYEYPYAPDGTLIHPGNASSYFILDPRSGSQGLERLLNSSNKTDQFKTILGTSFAYQILPELKVMTKAGIDYRNSTDAIFINPDSYYGSTKVAYTMGGAGRFEEGGRRNFNIVSTTGLTFNKIFNKVHDIEFSAFYEYVYNNFNSFGFVGFGIDGRLPETPAGVTNGSSTFFPAVNGGKTKSALASFMGVGRYTFDEKYTVTGSYRYDGSTKVAPGNKWHGFYSFGANWNAKKEDFLSRVDAVSNLSVRASYGITASPIGGDFNYLATYGSTSYGGVNGLRPTTPGNIYYDWEYVNEFNTGFDLGLFKNRLNLTVDYYNRITSNMFINQPLSATSGFTSLNLSSGKMRNRGVEFDINGDVIRTKDFTWHIGANAGYNKNKILHVTDIADSYPDGDTRVIQVGLPYGTYLAPKWAGVDPKTGDGLFYNKDGSITNVYNSNAQSVTESGSLYPTFTGGFNTSLTYKGITASALFTFVADVMRWNNEDFYTETQRYAPTTNQSVRMLNDRWKKEGDNAILQRYNQPRNYSSKDIQDASFLRLRNVNIGYSIPKHILEKTHFIKGVKVFVQGQNLLTWTKWRGLDPENNSVYGRFQYPNTRTYTAGLNVNF